MKIIAMRISGPLAASCRKTPERADWLDRLPEMVHELKRRWNLTPDVPLQGEDPSCSYVAAVLRADKTHGAMAPIPRTA